MRPCRTASAARLAWLAAAGFAAVCAAGQVRAEDLNAQANSLAKAQLEKMGDSYVAQIDRQRHIIYISALDDEHLRRTQMLLAAFADAQQRTLFTRPLPWNLTVILPTIGDYNALAKEQNLEHANGYFAPARRTLVSIDRGNVLAHEFTHALHQADMGAARQVHPIWVREGLATLFENSRITPSGLVPTVDTRLLVLRRADDAGALIPLDDLFKMGDRDFMADAELCYAQSRYAMFYLWQRHRLKQFYKTYKSNFVKDPTGRKAFEAAVGTRLYRIEPQWVEWLGALKLPAGYARSSRGRLGVEVKDDPRGVKVVGLLDGGAAQTAGRIQIGDIIEKLNSTEVKNPAQFFAVVRAAGSMKTVTLDVIRHNRRTTVNQPLGATPSK